MIILENPRTTLAKMVDEIEKEIISRNEVIAITDGKDRYEIIYKDEQYVLELLDTLHYIDGEPYFKYRYEGKSLKLFDILQDVQLLEDDKENGKYIFYRVEQE
jgi:hypothetical protein